MAKIKVDPDGITRYAKTVDKCASELAEQKHHLTTGQLPASAFGDLGKKVRTADAYARASTALLDQLSKAGVALGSASEELGKVAGHHSAGDADSAASIKRAARE